MKTFTTFLVLLTATAILSSTAGAAEKKLLIPPTSQCVSLFKREYDANKYSFLERINLMYSRGCLSNDLSKIQAGKTNVGSRECLDTTTVNSYRNILRPGAEIVESAAGARSILQAGIRLSNKETARVLKRSAITKQAKQKKQADLSLLKEERKVLNQKINALEKETDRKLRPYADKISLVSLEVILSGCLPREHKDLKKYPLSRVYANNSAVIKRSFMVAAPPAK